MKKRRSTIRIAEEGQIIEIPSRKPIGEIIFLPIWLSGWAIGEYFVISALFGETTDSQTGEPISWKVKAFLSVWLAGWTFGGLAAIHALSRIFFGKERICLLKDHLKVESRILRFSKEKIYDYAQIRDLRLAPEGMHKGQILFDYGSETVEMAREIDFAEAKAIFEEIVSLFNPNPKESNQSEVSIPLRAPRSTA